MMARTYKVVMQVISRQRLLQFVCSSNVFSYILDPINRPRIEVEQRGSRKPPQEFGLDLSIRLISLAARGLQKNDIPYY